MTLDEFLNAKKVESDEMYYVIGVGNYKTVAEHCPTDIVLDEPLYQLQQCYHEHFRNSIIESIFLCKIAQLIRLGRQPSES